MSPGHKWWPTDSGSFQEGFEANAEVATVLEAVQQGELVDEDGTEHVAARGDQAAEGPDRRSRRSP